MLFCQSITFGPYPLLGLLRIIGDWVRFGDPHNTGCLINNKILEAGKSKFNYLVRGSCLLTITSLDRRDREFSGAFNEGTNLHEDYAFRT